MQSGLPHPESSDSGEITPTTRFRRRRSALASFWAWASGACTTAVMSGPGPGSDTRRDNGSAGNRSLGEQPGETEPGHGNHTEQTEVRFHGEGLRSCLSRLLDDDATIRNELGGSRCPRPARSHAPPPAGRRRDHPRPHELRQPGRPESHQREPRAHREQPPRRPVPFLRPARLSGPELPRVRHPGQRRCLPPGQLPHHLHDHRGRRSASAW
jgi:hypothetical protein